MNRYIALLRGINVGGHNKIPMAELRALCGKIGLGDVRSYIQSGNLVFTAGDAGADLETTLESAIEQRFGLSIPVIVRTAKDWRCYLGGNPFPEASLAEPSLVALALSRNAPDASTAEQLAARAANDERVEQVGDAIWIHYPQGSARSKLTPTVLDRVVGSAVTARNWRTVQKLDALAESLRTAGR